jgi:hypothetical protein
MATFLIFFSRSNAKLFKRNASTDTCVKDDKNSKASQFYVTRAFPIVFFAVLRDTETE